MNRRIAYVAVSATLGLAWFTMPQFATCVTGLAAAAAAIWVTWTHHANKPATHNTPPTRGDDLMDLADTCGVTHSYALADFETDCADIADQFVVLPVWRGVR